MSETSTAKKIVNNPYFAMICFFFVGFILPRYGGIAVMVGCAGIMSAYVAVLPDQFRSRGGSMVTATCVVAAMWVGAAVTTALILMGVIR